MSYNTRSLPKPQAIKNWKQKWNWRWFLEEGKMFCAVCRKHQAKLKKMSGFPEAFTKGNENFKTSALSDHGKSKMHGKLFTKVNISKAQNVESNIFQLQCHCRFQKTLPF